MLPYCQDLVPRTNECTKVQNTRRHTCMKSTKRSACQASTTDRQKLDRQTTTYVANLQTRGKGPSNVQLDQEHRALTIGTLPKAHQSPMPSPCKGGGDTT